MAQFQLANTDLLHWLVSGILYTTNIRSVRCKHPSDYIIHAYGYDVSNTAEGFTISIMRMIEHSQRHLYVCAK